MPVPGTRTARPDPARVYDAMLGGRSNYAADREAADAIEAMFPGMRALVRAHREFARGAVTWLASRGVRQFIDVGSGLPSRRQPPIGQVARETCPDARAVYVNTEAVSVHVRALLPSGDAAVAGGDLGSAGEVMADAGLREVVDFTQPVGVLLCGVLGGMNAGRAREAVAGYTAALAKGSGVVISCVSYESQQAGDEAASAYEAATGQAWYPHSREVVESLFRAGGLDLLHERAMDTACWPMCKLGETKAVAAIGGIGIKR